MRTVDRPFKVSIENGLVRIECDGVIATIDPAMADAAGQAMLADDPLAIQGRIGKRLIESAALSSSRPSAKAAQRRPALV